MRPIELLQRSADARSREEIYELLALQNVLGEEDRVRRDIFWKGIVYYREHRWDEAAAAARRALSAGGRHTFQHQFPHGTLGDALAALATDGPPAVADSLVTAALAARPGWSRLLALRAAVALRVHDCERAFESFMTLLEFGIDRPDWPSLVQKCREERR